MLRKDIFEKMMGELPTGDIFYSGSSQSGKRTVKVIIRGFDEEVEAARTFRNTHIENCDFPAEARRYVEMCPPIRLIGASMEYADYGRERRIIVTRGGDMIFRIVPAKGDVKAGDGIVHVKANLGFNGNDSVAFICGPEGAQIEIGGYKNRTSETISL